MEPSCLHNSNNGQRHERKFQQTEQQELATSAWLVYITFRKIDYKCSVWFTLCNESINNWQTKHSTKVHRTQETISIRIPAYACKMTSLLLQFLFTLVPNQKTFRSTTIYHSNDTKNETGIHRSTIQHCQLINVLERTSKAWLGKRERSYVSTPNSSVELLNIESSCNS